VRCFATGNAMKKSFRKISIFLLAFVGISALPSGIALLLDPSGKSLHMSTALLVNSPFKDFVIPGAVLMCVLGIGSFAVLIILIRRKRPAPELDLFAGAILMGWVLFEMAFIEKLHVFQFLYLSIALILVFLGMKKERAVND
jgi:hypothetical protein